MNTPSQQNKELNLSDVDWNTVDVNELDIYADALTDSSRADYVLFIRNQSWLDFFSASCLGMGFGLIGEACSGDKHWGIWTLNLAFVFISFYKALRSEQARRVACQAHITVATTLAALAFIHPRQKPVTPGLEEK